MNRNLTAFLSLLVLSRAATAGTAVDSYHYLHVTIETPWVIFLVLAPMVLAPMVLMAIMVWRYAERRKENEANEEAAKEGAMEGGQE